MREQALGLGSGGSGGSGFREPCLEALSLNGEPQLQLVGRQADVVPGRVVAGPAGPQATVCHGARAHRAAAVVDPACYDSNYGQRGCMRAGASTHPSTYGRRQRTRTEARWAVSHQRSLRSMRVEAWRASMQPHMRWAARTREDGGAMGIEPPAESQREQMAVRAEGSTQR